MEKESDLYLNCSSSSSFFSSNPNPSWENYSSCLDQSDPFESALSSMVSSPTASNSTPNAPENLNVLRELIGRLGTICNSPPHPNFPCKSANTSCYSTPLNSPPKLNLISSSIMEREKERGTCNSTAPRDNHTFPSYFPFSADPGFAERAARFSCFANNHFNPVVAQSGPINKISGSNHNSSSSNNLIMAAAAVQESRGVVDGASSDKKLFSRLSRSSTPENVELEFGGDSRENSSVSELIPPPNDANSRKRKSVIPKAQAKETKDTTTYVASENSESGGAKRSKSEDGKEKDNKAKASASKAAGAAAEAPKDYIHVRARRGEATDAHSLAERVRREKISERMKVLQDLVPGCNKVTGKAVMLDEIINYVQSLQRQVEFLSMKLAAVNPRMDLDMDMEDAAASKDAFEHGGSLGHNMYQYNHPAESYRFHSQAPMMILEGPSPSPSPNVNDAGLGRNQSLHLMLHHPVDNFSETTTVASASASQVSTTPMGFWEDDLHSFVQMGFGGQSHTPSTTTNNNNSTHGGIRMKVEL